MLRDDNAQAIGNDGNLGIGIKNVKKNVERAVGADILFNED